jgi:peptidoglycan-associated lipoprotein
MGGLSGCKKQVSEIPPVAEEPPVSQADTSFSQPREMTIDTSDEAVFQAAELEEEMQRKVKQFLQPVYFDYGKWDLSAEALQQLSGAASFLNEYPTLRILIEGHCDERGSEEYNIGLGERRGEIVRQYLLKYGIDRIRMEVTSWGESRPAEPYCQDEECHSVNRRVEFVVLSK